MSIHTAGIKAHKNTKFWKYDVLGNLKIFLTCTHIVPNLK